jgi:hypothetical protein
MIWLREANLNHKKKEGDRRWLWWGKDPNETAHLANTATKTAMADHKAEGDRPPPACCQRCCAQVLTCCNIYPKPTDNDLHRPKCCGVKKISCVRLLSTITVITGSGMVASTVLSFHEPCDVPLAPLMLIISICFICYGFMFCGLPERWYRCGSLTVATTMICWLVPANYCK